MFQGLTICYEILNTKHIEPFPELFIACIRQNEAYALCRWEMYWYSSYALASVQQFSGKTKETSIL